jgi:hypothetical protein
LATLSNAHSSIWSVSWHVWMLVDSRFWNDLKICGFLDRHLKPTEIQPLQNVDRRYYKRIRYRGSKSRKRLLIESPKYRGRGVTVGPADGCVIDLQRMWGRFWGGEWEIVLEIPMALL